MSTTQGTAVVRVLVVDDERDLRESYAGVLAEEGYEVRGSGSSGEALALIDRDRFDVVLIDANISPGFGLDLLTAALATRPETRVVLMTDEPSVEDNIEALRAGAWDYLAKPFGMEHLKLLVGRAQHEMLSSATRAGADRPPGQGDGADGHELIGRSPAFLRVVELARKVANTSASVFLIGESGTGKEMVAQYLHRNSPRRARRLVAVNCAAMPEPLLESEMFGHARGVFPGETRDQPGLLEVADHGTIFLDELTDIPLSIQAKLLQVLQDGTVRRVGSETASSRVDVRFVGATNRDPREAIREGLLRSDLYFRLGVVPIHVPPLRERAEDIPLIAEHFLRKYWTMHRGPGTPRPTLTRAAMAYLRDRDWPGNVRELQNVIEYAVVLLDPGARIEPADLDPGDEVTPTALHGQSPANRELQREWAEVEYHDARDRVLGDFEHAYITSILRRAGFNMSKAAKMAGVDRTTLYRLMEKHGLERETHIRK